MDRLLVRAKEAAKMCGISRSTWYELYKTGMTPPPIKLGGCVCWSISSLQKWCELGCPTSRKYQRIAKGTIRIRRTKKNRQRTKEIGTRAKRLTNSYIKQVICDGTNLENADIPKELVETKKEHLKLKRLIKGTNNENNERSKRKTG